MRVNRVRLDFNVSCTSLRGTAIRDVPFWAIYQKVDGDWKYQGVDTLNNIIKNCEKYPKSMVLKLYARKSMNTRGLDGIYEVHFVPTDDSLHLYAHRKCKKYVNVKDALREVEFELFCHREMWKDAYVLNLDTNEILRPEV